MTYDQYIEVLSPDEMPIEEVVDLTIVSYYENFTLREWFQRVLLKLIHETEAFSGKRPLGNSDWYFDIASTFVQHRLVEGKVGRWNGDSWELISVNYGQTDALLEKCINYLLLKPIHGTIKLESE